MITSLAHVIVTEGWLAEDYIAERCDAKSFAQWKEFVARPENSPEAMAEVTGVAPDLVRGAARLYALGAEDHRSEEHTSELQSPCNLVCRLLLEKKKKQ